MSDIQGKCLCEQVKYEIDGELGPIFNCHCSKCRRWHAAAFRTRASVQKDQFKWLSGEECLSKFKLSQNATRYFCSNCGSPLITSYEETPEVYGIALGPLEGNIPNKVEAHIFFGSKAGWYEICDSIPQYDEWPGTESKVRESST
jgi:hypothetical protein